MPTTTAHSTRDRFLAQVELADERLHAFQNTLREAEPAGADTFAARCATGLTRCEELRAHILEWPEVEIGTASAVEDLGSTIDTLEADLAAATESTADKYRSAVDRQLRTWRARSDRLRLQGALGTMELRDELDDVGHRLADARSAVLVELRNATEDTKELVIDVRDDVEDVLVDVRHAVERAARALIDTSR